MNIRTYFAMVAVSASLCSGCQGMPEEQTAQIGQALPGLPLQGNNSNVRVGGRLGTTPIPGFYFSASPPAGISPSPTGWFVRTEANDYFAPITSITYNGTPVSNLTTTGGGWLQVTANNVTTKLTGVFLLTFQIGSPVNGLIEVQGGTDAPAGAPTYAKYTVMTHLNGAPSWAYFCPHTIPDGQSAPSYTINEPMIPVGGAKWLSNGARIDDSNSITLSCGHDSVGGCILWDYPPWGTATYNSRVYSLKATHQACTRMKRADICGDGGSSTTPDAGPALHTTLQVWDSYGVHPSSPQTFATTEGYWDANGAVCFNSSEYRTTELDYVALKDSALQQCPKPACSAAPSRLGWVASARPCLSTDANGRCTDN